MKDFVNCCETFWNSSLSHFPLLLILYDIHLPFEDTKFKRKSQTHTLTPIWLHNNDFYWSNVFEFYNKYPSERNLFFCWYQVPSLKTHTHSEKNLSTFTHTNWFHSPGSFEEKPTTNKTCLSYSNPEYWNVFSNSKTTSSTNKLSMDTLQKSWKLISM